MSDGIIITIDMVIKPELGEAVRAGIPAMMEDTPKFKGFRSIRVVQHEDDPNHLLIVEHWDTKEDYAAYNAFRNRDGGQDKAMTALLSYKNDAWPGLIGFKSNDPSKGDAPAA